jgi:mRNA-degrading endonuclease RelE of RelBE toxin-antitoxin system
VPYRTPKRKGCFSANLGKTSGVRIEWSSRAITTASRFLPDRAGIAAVLDAIDVLAEDPYPPGSFPWGEMLRLRVGRYRVMYVVEGDLITVDRVDRVEHAARRAAS